MMLNPPTSTDTAIITSINNNDDKDDDVFDLSSLDLFTASLPSSSSSSSTTITRFHLSPPHLETLSTSTTSSDPSTSTTIIVNNKIHNHNNAEDFHDCSSSVSSQETINSNSNVNDSTSTDQYSNINVNKRSVFTQYWNKTGQQPIPIRSMRSTFSSTTSLIHTCDIGSVSTNFLSSYSSPLPATSTSTVTFPEQDDSQLLCSVSNADLLEDDTVAKSDADVVTSITTPKGTEKRRRSILPAQKQNNHTATSDTDLIRETMSMNTSSWRKSTSLSSLQQRKRSTMNGNTTCSNNNIHHNHQHQSLTRLSSSTAPSTSCLRSFQRYSPSKHDTAAATAVITAVMDSSSLDLSASASSMLSLSSSTSTSSSCSSSSSVSSKSNVRFDLEVDVRHFEPPKEKYAHKGWSAQFF